MRKIFILYLFYLVFICGFSQSIANPQYRLLSLGTVQKQPDNTRNVDIDLYYIDFRIGYNHDLHKYEHSIDVLKVNNIPAEKFSTAVSKEFDKFLYDKNTEFLVIGNKYGWFWVINGNEESQNGFYLLKHYYAVDNADFLNRALDHRLIAYTVPTRSQLEIIHQNSNTRGGYLLRNYNYNVYKNFVMIPNLNKGGMGVYTEIFVEEMRKNPYFREFDDIIEFFKKEK